jgi:DNA-binding response OmpR family regulator
MGNTTLSRTTFELSAGDQTTVLANKEFQIMELLMANQKQFFSADRMMEKIWGYDSDADMSVVWVYISNLRKKITAINSNLQIKAARNIGYTLEIKE